MHDPRLTVNRPESRRLNYRAQTPRGPSFPGPAARSRATPPTATPPTPGRRSPSPSSPRGIVLSQNAASHAKPALDPPRTQAGANDADTGTEGKHKAVRAAADPERVAVRAATGPVRGTRTGTAVGAPCGQARTGPHPRLGPPDPGLPAARRGRRHPGGAAAPGRRTDPLPRVGLDGHVFVLRSLRTRRLRLDLLSRLPYVVRGDLSWSARNPWHRTTRGPAPTPPEPPPPPARDTGGRN